MHCNAWHTFQLFEVLKDMSHYLLKHFLRIFVLNSRIRFKIKFVEGSVASVVVIEGNVIGKGFV